MLAADATALHVYYVDDHFVSYEGARPVPKGWNTKRRHAQPGRAGVSLLLNLGVAPDMVREIVGHSDIEVAMTIYAHTSLDEKRWALGKLGDALA
jgi:integrase